MDFDIRAYRDALGSFPTGVAVITAQADGAGVAVGITVNSFTSVSLDPPLVLWCMDRRSSRHDHFAAAACFTVSILGTEHKEVSARLARPGEHALDGIALLPTELGPPALADSLAVFDCLREQHPAGRRPYRVDRPGIALRPPQPKRAAGILQRQISRPRPGAPVGETRRTARNRQI